MNPPDHNPTGTLFIVQHPTSGLRHARDAIEAALAFAAYQHRVGLLFMGDGVFQLIDRQNNAIIGQKSHPKLLSALPLYDIEEVYACQRSLIDRGLQQQPMCVPVQQLACADIRSIYTSYNKILSF